MGGRGLGATEHTRGRPAVILRDAPLGNESPIHRQFDQLHPKREMESWRAKQDPDPVNSEQWRTGDGGCVTLCYPQISILADCTPFF